MRKMTINEIFLENAERYKNDTIIKYKRQKAGTYSDMTWGELKDAVTSFATGLIKAGMETEDKLAILSFNRIEWILADLGTLLAGGVDVPIYHTNTPEQCAYIIKDSEAKFVIVEDVTQLEKILSVEKELQSLKKIILIEGNPPNRNDKVITFSSVMRIGEENKNALSGELDKRTKSKNPGDLATIVYTSGTTGPPKGCMVSHQNTSFVLKSIDDLIQIDPNTNMSLLILPLSHFYPRVSGYYYNIYKNITLVIAESIDTLAQNMIETGPTYFCSVPRIFEKVYARISGTADKGPALKRLIFRWAVKAGRRRSRLLNAKRSLSPILNLKFKIADALVFKKIRSVLGGKLWFAVSAGAPLSSEVAEFIHSIGIQVIEFYGLTETLGGTMTTFDECRYGTVGKPMPGFDIKLATDGEILIKGNNFMGYFNKQKLTDEILKGDWCYTGDVGRWDDDGFLIITDRKKDLIITSGGKNISPQNIENMIKEIPLVSNVMVHGDKRKYLTALITLDDIETKALANERGIPYATYDELIKNIEIAGIIEKGMDGINKRLAKFETIKKFSILPRDFLQEEGEITPTLKIKRKVIYEKYRGIVDSMYEKEIE